MADNTNGEASSLPKQVGQAAKVQTQHVKEQAQQVVQQGQQAASHVWEFGRSQFQTLLTTQKDRAADSIGSVAQMLHSTGEQFREQGQAGGGHIADNIADRISQFSDSLHEKEIAEILADTESFARKNPVAFLSIAALFGFVLARFLKSSEQAASAA